jgi:hypothetical protein
MKKLILIALVLIPGLSFSEPSFSKVKGIKSRSTPSPSVSINPCYTPSSTNEPTPQETGDLYQIL